MKAFILIICCLFLSTFIHSQTCKDVPLTKGQKFKVEMNTYPIPIQVFGAALYTMKKKEKNAKIDELKANVLSGKTASTKTTMESSVTNVTVNGNQTEYELTTLISGVEYKSYIACNSDSFIIFRGKGFQPTVYNKDTIGFSILGAQIIPNNLKVGDNVPGYSDLGQTYPATENRKVSHVFRESDPGLM